MIRTREHLIHMLTEAAEVEHNLLCSYLYAVFSLKRAGEPGLSPAQAEAVESWRESILAVALEEMAHLATVNNLLLAIGGAPHFDRPNFPVAPGYHPAGVVVRLTPFDRATLDHFIFLERSADLPLDDARGFDPVNAERQPRRHGLTPTALDYDTIGELYDALADGFRDVAGQEGEAALFDRQGRGQLDSAVVRLPNIPRVTMLTEALAAIERIKEEGEGSTGKSEQSHFDRFVGIRDAWREFAAADPGFAPAWPAAHDPVMRKPLADAERVWITSEPAASCLDLGNALYGAMLQLLAQAFSAPVASHQTRLMRASVEVMEACAVVATALARMPAGDAYPGVNAGLTFAVPRNLGFRPTGAVDHVVRRLRAFEAKTTLLSGASQEKLQRRLGQAVDLLTTSDLPA